MENQYNRNQDKQQQQNQQQVVLFKFKRGFHEQSYDEIKIQSKKIKPNPQSMQKATLNYKNKHFLDKQTMLTNLFQKLELNQKSSNQQQKYQFQNQKQDKQSIKSTKIKQFFLKKVQLNDLQFPKQNEAPSIKSQQSNVIRDQMRNIKSIARKTDLQQRFNKLRNINQKPQVKKRIKYKIIDIKQQNIVDFNGQKFEYEDLSKQYGPDDKSIAYDFYVLKRGKLMNENKYPEIILPQQAEYLLEDEADKKMQIQSLQDSQQDSNREDRSDYDYPEQEYHEGDSDKQSEDLIEGQNEYGSDNEDLRNSYEEQDEEEYYRQYLRRCKKKQQGDDQLTYLYNLKPTKYQDSDDDY